MEQKLLLAKHDLSTHKRETEAQIAQLKDQMLRMREFSHQRANSQETTPPVKDSRAAQLEVRLSEAVSAALAAQAHVSQLQIQYQQMETANRELQSQLDARQV